MRVFWKFTAAAIPAAAYLVAGWAVGLVLLAAWVVAMLALFTRTRAAVAPATRCPRGHEVPQYGLHRCACGAVTESWVWRCPICSTHYGHTACPTCGLAVRNPLVR